jgi:hypothetical protein
MFIKTYQIQIFILQTMKLLRDNATTTRTLRSAIDTNFTQLQQFALSDETTSSTDANNGGDTIAVDLQSSDRMNDVVVDDDDDDVNGVNMSDELRSAMERALAAVRNAKAQRAVETTIVISDDEIEEKQEKQEKQESKMEESSLIDDPVLSLARREREAIQREFNQLDDEITSRERQIARLRAEIDSLHAQRRQLAPTLFAFESSTGSWHS